MPLSPQDWHARYTRQAGWTRSLRRYVFERIPLSSVSLLLDAGCGTGALEADGFHGRTAIVGLDIDLDSLDYAKNNNAPARWVQGDVLRLPFPSNRFDIAFCHFLLLWVPDPLQALKEMSRVTRPGGYILALAEPDYGGRIDFPPELEILGNWQMASLRQQGANPLIGRRLSWLFNETGLEQIETGVLGAQWQSAPSKAEIESEWAILHSDLEQLLGSGEVLHWQADYDKFKHLDETSWQQGERVLFVPTFYAMGKKPL